MHAYIHTYIRSHFGSSMGENLPDPPGGGPDPPASPASDHCSQGSNVPSTPAAKRTLFQAWLVTPSRGAPGTPASKRQCVLPFAATPRTPRTPAPRSCNAPSTQDSQDTPDSGLEGPGPTPEVVMGPALQKLMLSARTHPDQAGLIQQVSYWEKKE